VKEPSDLLVASKLRDRLNRTLFGRIKLWLLTEEKRGYEKAIVDLMEYNRFGILLDLGYGDGRLTTKLVERTGSVFVYGFDLGGKGVPGVMGFKADLNNELRTKQEWDVVVASQIIEHLWNTDGFLEEIHRVLKPTGYAIISTPNLASWHNILYLLFGKQPEPCSVSDEMDWVEGPAHRRLFTIPGLTKLLEFHGFKIEKVVPSGYHPFPGWMARFMCLIDGGHSTSINIKVRKSE